MGWQQDEWPSIQPSGVQYCMSYVGLGGQEVGDPGGRAVWAYVCG